MAGIPQVFVMLRVVANADVHVLEAEVDETVLACVVIPSGIVDELRAPWAKAESLAVAAVVVVESLQVPVSLGPRVLVPKFGEPETLLVTRFAGLVAPAGLVGVSNTDTLYSVPTPVLVTIPFTG